MIGDMFVAIIDQSSHFDFLYNGRILRPHRSFDGAWSQYRRLAPRHELPLYFVGADGEVDLLDSRGRAIRRL